MQILFTTKADQVLSKRSTVIAMYLCKHKEADTCVNSTWNMLLIRGKIKPTAEQWTRVIILAISHLHHLRYGSSGWHAKKFQFMWYVISKQLGAQCSQALLLFHAYIGCDFPLALSKMNEMCWMSFMLQTLLSPWPETQPALSSIPRIWHVWNT